MRTLSLVILFTWILLSVFSGMLGLDPQRINLEGILQPPHNLHWLGQDDLGRSIVARVITGGQTSLLVALTVTSIVAVMGITIGAIAAWFGGRVEHMIIRVIDVFMAFPGVLLAIALAGILGPGLSNLVIALSVVGWVGFARLTRAQILVIKHRDHIQAAHSLGTPTAVIMMRHLLPLAAAPLLVEATFTVASVIIAEAGLSFLGIGIQPPEASWGNMIKDGSRYLLVAPHMVIVPGLALALVVFSVNQLGDWLRDSFDVKGDVR